MLRARFHAPLTRCRTDAWMRPPAWLAVLALLPPCAVGLLPAGGPTVGRVAASAMQRFRTAPGRLMPDLLVAHVSETAARARTTRPLPPGWAATPLDALPPPPPPPLIVPPERPPLWVYVDADLAVLDKPAGMPSVPGSKAWRGPENDRTSLVEWAAEQLQLERSDNTVVHRLDFPTSGLLCIARNHATLAALHKQWRDRTVRKRYVAAVAGDLRGESGRIDAAFKRRNPQPPRRALSTDPSDAQRAETLWWRDEAGAAAEGTTLVKLEPVTGRAHQLRAHLASIGHPILGDKLYGCASVEAAHDRLMLHASELAFTHPTTGARVELVSDPGWHDGGGDGNRAVPGAGENGVSLAGCLAAAARGEF